MIRPLLLAAALLLQISTACAFFIPVAQYADEWINDYTGRRVLTSNAIEATALERGQAGPGWERTGYRFQVVSFGFESDDQVDVCRFYSHVNNSHFFTANAGECNALKAPGTGWIYEGIAFKVRAPRSDCGDAQPVYRLYNNHPAGDVAHRYTSDPSVRSELIAAGWADEGVAWCTPLWTVVAQKTFSASSGSHLGSLQECESHVGACVALSGLPAMPNVVKPYLPPFYIELNPDYPFEAAPATGTGGDIFTAQAVTDTQSIAAHSYVIGSYGPPFGLHLSPLDRTSNPLMSVDAMYELPGIAGTVDERVFPWKGPHDHKLVASFTVHVPTVKRTNPSSHAYGVLVLQFADTVSGRSFFATVQAYSTLPPGDFVSTDVSGRALVSTVFRTNPAFGIWYAGDFAQCRPELQAICIAAARRYIFAIDRAGFEKALGLARTVDPTLSTNAANYFVAQVRVHNETFGDAELGATVDSLNLQVWY